MTEHPVLSPLERRSAQLTMRPRVAIYTNPYRRPRVAEYSFLTLHSMCVAIRWLYWHVCDDGSGRLRQWWLGRGGGR